jgi:hypothetical protein
MRWCVLAMVVGCGEIEEPPRVVADHVTLDVVIAPSGLTIYATSPLADPSCTARFPAIGTTVFVGDVWTPCDPPLFGCIEQITYAGGTHPVPANEAPLAIASPPSGTVLELEGCGVRTAIALPIVTLPPPPALDGSITYDASNRVVDVGWNSDPRAASHLVTLATSLWSEVHRVAGGDDRFTTPYLGNLFTIVQTLLPGREQITPLGLVRLWPASEPATFQLQAAPRIP